MPIAHYAKTLFYKQATNLTSAACYCQCKIHFEIKDSGPEEQADMQLMRCFISVVEDGE